MGKACLGVFVCVCVCVAMFALMCKHKHIYNAVEQALGECTLLSLPFLKVPTVTHEKTCFCAHDSVIGRL